MVPYVTPNRIKCVAYKRVNFVPGPSPLGLTHSYSRSGTQSVKVWSRLGGAWMTQYQITSVCLVPAPYNRDCFLIYLYGKLGK